MFLRQCLKMVSDLRIPKVPGGTVPLTGKALTNATYQISSGSASWAKKYPPEQREMICRLLSYGHSLPSIKALEKKHPGELHVKVCAGVMALKDGQGRCRVTRTWTNSDGTLGMEYDQNQQVAQMCSIAAKPPKRLPDSSSEPLPKKKTRKAQKSLPPPSNDSPQPSQARSVKAEPLEEDSFLIRVDDSDDELHGKVVERLRGKGYTVTKNGSSSSS